MLTAWTCMSWWREAKLQATHPLPSMELCCFLSPLCLFFSTQAWWFVWSFLRCLVLSTELQEEACAAQESRRAQCVPCGQASPKLLLPCSACSSTAKALSRAAGGARPWCQPPCPTRKGMMSMKAWSQQFSEGRRCLLF